MSRFVNTDALDAAVRVADAAVSLQSEYTMLMARLDSDKGNVHNWWRDEMSERYAAFVRSVVNYAKMNRGV